jgi:hypothetical protein
MQLRAWSRRRTKDLDVLIIIHVRIFVVFACLAAKTWWKFLLKVALENPTDSND